MSLNFTNQSFQVMLERKDDPEQNDGPQEKTRVHMIFV